MLTSEDAYRYKTCNTPSALAQLTDVKLIGLGVDGKEDRKLALAALRKAGYATGRKRRVEEEEGADVAGPSNMGAVQVLVRPLRAFATT